MTYSIPFSQTIDEILCWPINANLQNNDSKNKRMEVCNVEREIEK